MGGNADNPYLQGLERNDANYVPLTPISLLKRAARIYPDFLSVIHGDLQFTWSQTYQRCRRLASALSGRGIGLNQSVSVIAANIPAMFELHFAVPMAGAVLNTINTRLDAAAIAFILDHAEAKILFVSGDFKALAEQAVSLAQTKPPMIMIDEEGADPASGYERFVAGGDPGFQWAPPADEWQAISLSYTSGTTGNPKGVVTHHRGAYLNALCNALSWNMGVQPRYLWTLPMFHCNGWCFPWTITAVAGTHVCLRAVTAKAIYAAMAEHGVTHLCGAPIVMGMIANASPEQQRAVPAGIRMMTAGAAPPAAVIEKIERLGFKITHVYGLTEVYGPVTVCAWHEMWDELPIEQQAVYKARQGVNSSVLEGLMVADPLTLEPVPSDGETIGEVFMRGNVVMRGYLKNPKATSEAFEGGWFHTGDLAVMHENGYIEIKDRSKDIIISGGENISTIEVESVLYRHPAVAEAAVVARPDSKWGETPCAFVTLRPGATATSHEIIHFCRDNLARYKVPRTVVFTELPKTSTGKIQKYVLRQRAREL